MEEKIMRAAVTGAAVRSCSRASAYANTAPYVHADTAASAKRAPALRTA